MSEVHDIILPDYSEWLTPERLAKEEKAWEREKFEHDYAEPILRLKPYTVIEVGCGTGRLANLLPEDYYYQGIDNNAICVQAAKQGCIKQNPFGTWFDKADIREKLEFRFTHGYNMVCAFAFLKHFGLHEWDSILKKLISLSSRYAVFTQPIAEEDKDTGTEFHHVFVTKEHVLRVLEEEKFQCLQAYPLPRQMPEWMFVAERVSSVPSAAPPAK